MLSTFYTLLVSSSIIATEELVDNLELELDLELPKLLLLELLSLSLSRLGGILALLPLELDDMSSTLSVLLLSSLSFFLPFFLGGVSTLSSIYRGYSYMRR